MWVLAISDSNGIGVKQNSFQQVYWIARAAAELNHPQAVRDLGGILQRGEFLADGKPIMLDMGNNLLEASGHLDEDRARKAVTDAVDEMMKYLSGYVYNL